MAESGTHLVERLFDAFNRRDADEIAVLCDEERMEFFAVTAEAAGHDNPYTGIAGLNQYLDDVARIWEELLITPTLIEEAGSAILVRGRVYLRSRALGIRDMPTGWIWEHDENKFVRGRVFIDPAEAAASFRSGDPTEPNPDPGGSGSTTRLR